MEPVLIASVFPAPAGINRDCRWLSAGICCVPRASGDKPRRSVVRQEKSSVFPAPAGINRRCRLTRLSCAGVPRASGDKPQGRRILRQMAECSPRQRG